MPIRRIPRFGRGPLSSAELAEAAVLADLAAALLLLGWLVPGPVGGIIQSASATPFVALAMRRRLRAVVIGSIGGAFVALLVAGPGAALALAGSAAVGWIVGFGLRKGWSAGATWAFGMVVAWVPGAALTVGALYVFAELRKLTLEQFRIGWLGVRRIMKPYASAEFIELADNQVKWALTHWYVAIPYVEAFFITIAILVARAIAKPAIRRLTVSFAAPAAEGGLGGSSSAREAREAAIPPTLKVHAQPGPPGPLPVALDRVCFRYPGSERDALSGVTLRIPAGTFVAVLGDNGSGKSTLARVLAGAAPTAGTIDRPGDAGLGRPGGTALILQRPEAQVLGVRVRDDVVWGLHDASAVDVAALLARAGLAGFEDRETSTLSGGELQRLAVAAAVARRPSLLVSDESTAMLDPGGRRDLMRVLRELPRTAGVGVVHITHRTSEAADADTVIVLSGGRVVADGPPAEVLALDLVR